MNEVKQDGEFKYLETDGEGSKTPLLLLHGLMGSLSNFQSIVDVVGKDRKVLLPMLPLFEIPIRKLDLEGLVEFVERFLSYKNIKRVSILGNSLGGHLCQILALKRPEIIEKMILTGSSGLFENSFGNTFPKRGNREFIRKKTEMVFYDKSVATEEMVDEVYGMVNDLSKAIRIVKIAKSAVRHNLEHRLHEIKTPTLLVWGKEDTVTPFWVAEKFLELLPNARLVALDQCGHAPMMEHPHIFNRELISFLDNKEIF